MSRSLQIAEHLKLPLDIVTQKVAILGMTGSGKSYCMTKLCELFMDARAQIVILDPKGEAWGLRLMADGITPAYPIPVFGGDHADMPLRPDMGRRIAELLVNGDYSAVLDVSEFISAELHQFSYDFATRLFELKKRKPGAMSLFVDEAQEFMPQNPNEKGMEPKMLHAFERVAKQLRSKGVGMVMVGQRPQEINKKCLTQSEVWIVFQMTGEQERKTMGNIFTTIDSSEVKKLQTLLPVLEVGTSHIWSPRLLKVAAEFPIGLKRTFDSSKTPAVGARRVVARRLAPLDAEAMLAEALKDVIEEEEAKDPEKLQGEVKNLRDYQKTINLNVPEPYRQPQLDLSMVRMREALWKAEREAIMLRGRTIAPAKEKIVIKTVEKPMVKDLQIKRLETLNRALGQRLDAVIGPLATIGQFKVCLDGLIEGLRAWQNFRPHTLTCLTANQGTDICTCPPECTRTADCEAEAHFADCVKMPHKLVLPETYRPEPRLGPNPEGRAVIEAQREEVVGRIVQGVGELLADTNGEYDMADFETFYQLFLERMRAEGLLLAAQVSAPVFVLKQFQTAEVARILAEVDPLNEFQRKSLKFIDARGVRLSKAEVLQAVTGKLSSEINGRTRTARYDELEGLVKVGLCDRDSNGMISTITNSIKTRLASFNASGDEIEAVRGQVLLKIQ